MKLLNCKSCEVLDNLAIIAGMVINYFTERKMLTNNWEKNWTLIKLHCTTLVLTQNYLISERFSIINILTNIKICEMSISCHSDTMLE